MRKISKLITSLLFIALLATEAFAAPAWYTCNVTRTGTTSYADVSVVYLTDTAATPAYTNKPFKFASATLNAQLATALTAISSGKTVYVYADPTGSIGQITNIYLNAN